MNNRDEQKKLNEKHANFPQPGDYWQEMFVPICVVLDYDIQTDDIAICKTKKDVDPDHWTWDLSVITIMPREHWKQWISYTVEGLGYWCDVLPGRHIAFAREYKPVQLELDFVS